MHNYPARQATIDHNQLNLLLAPLVASISELGLRVSQIHQGTVAPTIHCVLPFRRQHIRPGDTLSGPSMMMLADAAMYALILSVDSTQLLAVTQNLTIHFLHKPAAADLLAVAQCLKYGKRSVVMQVDISSNGILVAQATGSYILASLEQTNSEHC